MDMSHKAKLPNLTITYWTMDESEEEGIDNTITVIIMLVDYLTGDLVFVSDENGILVAMLNDIVLDCMHACVIVTSAAHCRRCLTRTLHACTHVTALDLIAVDLRNVTLAYSRWMAKPVLFPEPFSGEAEDWDEWLSHFESVAVINNGKLVVRS